MQEKIKNYLGELNQLLARHSFGDRPKELYEPIRYILGLGGKRLRPLFTLLSYNLFSEDISKALKPALAVEVFHNFTLMHDDIMDNAPIRRGKPTVHQKWNANAAILSGDVMLVRAYDFLLDIEPGLLMPVIKKFNDCASEVCEGQQIDMNFEKYKQVTVDQYLEMIRLKTAVLLGFSLELGALLAGADQMVATKLKNFGANIGIGFQLKDDLLDVYADQAKFGKQVGGDIISNKKTFLLIKSLEMANDEQLKSLEQWLSKKDFDAEKKVAAVKQIYDALDIKTLTETSMNEYFSKGFEIFDNLNFDGSRKTLLRNFVEDLIDREN